MDEKNYLTNNEIELKNEEMMKCSYKCECGHTVIITNHKDRTECSHCHRLVFKNESAKFRYIMRRKLIEERRKLK